MIDVKRLVFVFLVGCGGTVSSGDDAEASPDASPLEAATLEDASFDVAVPDGEPLGVACVTDAGTFACDAGNGWAWGDAGSFCGEPCLKGSSCYTLGAGSSSGVCE